MYIWSIIRDKTALVNSRGPVIILVNLDYVWFSGLGGS